MQSDGGLASVDGFSGHKAILSGPAGGYVGYALTTRWRDSAGRPVTPGDGAGDGGAGCCHSGDDGMQVGGWVGGWVGGCSAAMRWIVQGGFCCCCVQLHTQHSSHFSKTRPTPTPPHTTQVIGFDMGGTSTDVSRYAGSYEHVFETTTAGVTIQVRFDIVEGLLVGLTAAWFTPAASPQSRASRPKPLFPYPNPNPDPNP